MRFAPALLALSSLAFAASSEGARQEPKILEKTTTLPVALDKDFEFRKTKLVLLNEKTKVQGNQKTTSSLNKKSSNSPNQKT